MISKLTGTPEIESTDRITLVNRGIGYDVCVTPKTTSSLANKQNVTLYVHTHVKDDALELYGFDTKQQRVLFRHLIGVSGIGPKTGMTIIDFGVSGVTNAVIQADIEFFKQIPKVGKKSAQKIIIELTSKLGSISDLDLRTDQETDDIMQTLTAMGFDRHHIARILRDMPETVTDIEGKIKHAIRELGK